MNTRDGAPLTPKPRDFEPEPTFPEGHPHHGRPRCTAWSARNGRQCLAIAITGTTKCRVHGGATPRGLASPHFKSGRYSRVLPIRLAVTFRRLVRDETLLDLRAEIALIDVRLQDLVASLQKTDTTATWTALQHAYQRLTRARDQRDAALMAAALHEIGQLIAQGVQVDAVWKEIIALIEYRRRLVETESRRRRDAQLALSVDELLVLLSDLAATIKSYVEAHCDPPRARRILDGISREFGRVVSFTARGTSEAV